MHHIVAKIRIEEIFYLPINKIGAFLANSKIGKCLIILKKWLIKELHFLGLKMP